MFRSPLLFLLLVVSASAQDYDALILSQGAFGAQNSAVDRVGTDANGVFVNSLAAGRIYTQGAAIIGGRLYLTAGSSFAGTSRIDVYDVATGQIVGQTTEGLLNPRYIAEVAPGKAYVTNADYGEGPSFVTPYDLATGAVGDRIEVVGTPEDVTLSGGRAFVALGAFGGADSLAVLDPATDALVGYVDIGCSARFAIDTFAALWAICTDTDEAVALNSETLEVTQRVAFDAEIGDPNGSGQDAAPLLLPRPTRRPAGAFTEETGDAVLISSDAGLIVLDEFGRFEIIPIDGLDTRPITALAGDTPNLRYYLGRPDASAPFEARGSVTVYSFEGDLVAQVDVGVFPSYAVPNPDLFGPIATESTSEGGFGLALAGPHPATQTTLALTLDRAADVRVEVFDVLGRPVARLADGPLGTGTHRVAVDASRWPAGTYLVRATADGRAATLALVVAR
ncbi:T9SS type A sorting domain-containing protein [Rubrivirga sp.]|uniref:T9SS type A sorting domain-containing protein n=1 Tax=Rubrivirga sp. TaxID=1885344 RepID=UPI003B51AA72